MNAKALRVANREEYEPATAMPHSTHKEILSPVTSMDIPGKIQRSGWFGGVAIRLSTYGDSLSDHPSLRLWIEEQLPGREMRYKFEGGRLLVTFRTFDASETEQVVAFGEHLASILGGTVLRTSSRALTPTDTSSGDTRDTCEVINLKR